MNDTPPGWIPDSGLGARSVASMTPDEAKEYLGLVIRYVAPSELPSLAWLRRAIAASSNSQPAASVTLDQSQSADAASPALRRENAVRQLQDLLRRAPVRF
jgi:hypothetical protein